MRYSVDKYVFEKNPNICFGIIIGRNLKNEKTKEEDSEILAKSEAYVRENVKSDEIKTFPKLLVYREALQNVDINPNKYTNSIEAMTKRIVKGGNLPRINAMVDLLNAVALKEMITLGGHDLADIKSDLEVRLSTLEDKFLPFGETEFESMPEGELVFTSGNEVQTRQWLWRQSELGKMTLDTTDVFFQAVGFNDKYNENFKNALEEVKTLFEERFGGNTEVFILDKDNPSIKF